MEVDAPFGSAKADTSAFLEREDGADGRPVSCYGGASIGPSLLMLLPLQALHSQFRNGEAILLYFELSPAPLGSYPHTPPAPTIPVLGSMPKVEGGGSGRAGKKSVRHRRGKATIRYFKPLLLLWAVPSFSCTDDSSSRR